MLEYIERAKKEKMLNPENKKTMHNYDEFGFLKTISSTEIGPVVGLFSFCMCTILLIKNDLFVKRYAAAFRFECCHIVVIFFLLKLFLLLHKFCRIYWPVRDYDKSFAFSPSNVIFFCSRTSIN